MSLAGFAWRNANAWWDWQLAAARSLWRLETEADGARDTPDYAAFLRRTQHGACDLFAQSAAHMLATVRNAAQMLGAIQLRLAHMAQAQTDEAAIGVADGAALFGEMADAANGMTADGAGDRSTHVPASRTSPASRTPRQQAPARTHGHGHAKSPRRGGARATH